MMKKTLLLLIFFYLVYYTPNLKAQDAKAEKASSYGMIGEPVLVPSLAQQMKDGTFIGVDPNAEPKLGAPKRKGANKNVPGKGLPHGDDALVQNQKAALSRKGKDPILVFDAHSTNVTPSDPTGAAGPNHYIGAWNMSFRIFDKEGNPLTSVASLATLFPGNTAGDPIVFYDAEADRFVITEFDHSPNGFNVAVCQGSDPVNDGWYTYTTGFGTGNFPDYTKFSVWRDGYYVTANISQQDRVFAIERDEMLLGNAAQFVGFPLTGIRTSGFYSPQFFHVTNDDLPSSGGAPVVYMQDDAWSGVSEDHLKIWTVNVDWDDIANSTISAPQEIITTPFIGVFDGGSFSNVPQPSGPNQDVLQATIMNQAQYRRFPGHNSAVFNFVVDTDGSGGELAGIRWYELRQDDDGDPWEIYQEGTYISPYNDKHAFSGSMVMDVQGNIGMGYTTCNQSEKIAIYYTGRFAADPLGTMSVDETLIAQGTSNNPSNRLADYVQLSLDPADELTFWHIAEYFVNNQRTDVVGVFQISTYNQTDVGISSIDEPVDGIFTDTEPVTVSIYNYGDEAQSDIPVNFQVDDGDIITEVFPGPLDAFSSAQYTFIATADLSTGNDSYKITSFTDLVDDEDRTNDTTVKYVTYEIPIDIGVSAITTPISGTGLTSTEEITVLLENFGSLNQMNFDVTYNLDDNIVTEIFPDRLGSTPTLFTFEQTGDFAEPGIHNLSAYTSLLGDTVYSNDTTTVVIENTMCQPKSNCSRGDGFFLFKLGTIDNITECSPNGYGDYTNLSTELANNSITELNIITHYGNQYVKIWIDFNDNFVFEEDEVIVNNVVVGLGSGSGVFEKTIPFVIPDGINLGQHLMRAKSNYNAPVPEDACEETELGETEDYMTELVLFIGTNEIPLANEDMIIKTLGNNKFEVSLESSQVTETLIINLHNVLGQKLVENRVKNTNGRYVYNLDLSYAKPGAYIVRLGSYQYGKVQKIFVK